MYGMTKSRVYGNRFNASSDVGCETYRCKDARGDDIFVINGCAKQKIKEKSTKCTLDVELDQFCSLKADRLAAPSCSLCYKEECNLKTIELEKKNDPNDDFCYHTVRYINKNTLPRDLLSFLKKNLGITPKIRETVSCKNGRAGCQVFRCSDNADNDQFRVTACATSDSDCTNGLNQFCTRGLLPQCQRCLDKKCSQRSTELQGSEAADNPTMYDGPNPGLRCLLKRICALLDAVKQKKSRWKTVKLSRRFAPRWPKTSKKSKDVADPSFNLYADLSEELEDSPANEMNRMFMDEYLVAIGAVIDVNCMSQQ
ncbi:hypothetical protein GPALN_004969 [Globodera pallida]|nr:hypothetical protein GPALN_004969 [Globodera pallida]